MKKFMKTKNVEITNGHGGLPLVKIKTPWSAAEIYLTVSLTQTNPSAALG